MELKNFFRNSIGLAIFGISKGDWTTAQLCFTAEGVAEPFYLELDLIPGYPSSLWMHTIDRDHNMGTQDYSFSVKDTETLKIAKPTLEFLEQKFAGVTGVIKVKATLKSTKSTATQPMEFDADSTGWKWPSYYTEEA